MRKALLHPLCCAALCAAAIYLMRRTFGVPGSSLWLGLFLAGCGYACNLALIPWICLSDWGRVMRKKKMGDAGVMTDPVFILLMTFQPRYVLIAVIGACAAFWTNAASIAGIGAVSLMASATHASWRVMRWTPNPT